MEKTQKDAREEYLELQKQEDALEEQIKELKQKKEALQQHIIEVADEYKKVYIVRVYSEACIEIGIPAFTEEDAIETAKYECGNWSFPEWDGFASGPIRAEIVCEEKDYEEKMKLGCKWIDGHEDDDEEK